MLRLNRYTDVAYHSGACKPGCCFVAIAGLSADGHRHIPEALRKGATTVVVQKEVELPSGVEKIVVPDTREALARLSAQYFGEPSRELTLVGVTGTNGKTTVTHLLARMARHAGFVPSLLGTLHTPTGRTTPESYDLQKSLRRMQKEGTTHAILEVTSHALAQKRVNSLHFDGAVFTNLSRDHLDFHADMEDYFEQKAKLFRHHLVQSAKKKRWVVVNWDDPYGRRIADGIETPLFRFSKREPVEFFLEACQPTWEGLRLKIKTPQGKLEVDSPLKGRFQSENILAALAAGAAMGIPPEVLQKAVVEFEGAPGRMETIANERGLHILVDYAHTPEALSLVLDAIRELRPKRLITVFGCGGNRDRGKRPLMGKTVSQKSDIAVVTSDNPRREDPKKIIDEVLTGVAPPSKIHSKVERKEAMALALEAARPGDCVLIAGKGHETTQEIGNEKRPFDDREIVRKLLAEKK